MECVVVLLLSKFRYGTLLPVMQKVMKRSNVEGERQQLHDIIRYDRKAQYRQPMREGEGGEK